MEDRGSGLSADGAAAPYSRGGVGGRDPALFVRDLRRYTKKTWVTPTLIAINVALFAWQVVSGVDFTSPSIDDLLKWGANFGPLTTHGEWWRLFTACFLHIGILHIAFNMFAMWRSGVFVEQLFGNFPFLVLYLVSGLGGSAVSLLLHANTVSAGASGAIFGIFGGLAGYLARNRNSMPKAFLRSLTSNVGQVVVLNIIIGFAVPQIDMAAHGGGLVFGAVLGFILAQPMTESGVRRRNPVAAIVLVASVLAVVAGTRFVPERGNLVLALQRVQQLDNAAVSTLQESSDRFDRGELSADAFATSANAAKAKWVQAIALLDALTNLSPSELDLREKYRQYCRLRTEQVDATIDFARAQSDDAHQRIQDLRGRIETQLRAIEQARQTQ